MAYVSLDSEQVKKANKKHKYTAEQVLQLEKCMDLKTGPLYFMENFVKIQHPTKGSMAFKPYDYQKHTNTQEHQTSCQGCVMPTRCCQPGSKQVWCSTIETQ
jgi:hypothetical protein